MANDRVIGQTKGAGFQVGVRRSFSISSEDAWNLLTSPDGLNLWLGESTGIILNPGQTYMTNLGSGEIRIVKPLQQLRLTWKKEGWEQPSTVQIRVLSKADNQLCLGIIASRIGFVLRPA
ncbi:SRPBCC domain-containing protein [Lysinibacillus sp. NPDC047702]|uniref:SRPBCC domain-containing protein n=1 Tax=unclassified Lysinibacillus TaxID=2636778 RepID=UPI003D047483